LNQGLDVVEQLFENHPVIIADLGIVDHMFMLALDAVVTRQGEGDQSLVGVHLQYLKFRFTLPDAVSGMQRV
jgi:hypothetical protein